MLRGEALELCVRICPEQRLHFREFPIVSGSLLVAGQGSAG
jgi:hypothetical protein